MKTLALIPARSGSKGIPNKNFRDFCGMPLFIWAIDVGLETCDRVAISTDATPNFETDVLHIPRPRELAQDDTPMLAVVQHALMHLGDQPDVVVLLQPTQPLRQRKHIRAALKLLEETGADSVVSVVEIPAHYHPDVAIELETIAERRYDQPIRTQISSRATPHAIHWNYQVNTWDDIPSTRQDLRYLFARDGTVYAIRRETIEAGSLYGADCRALIIPHSESCNIDTEIDWKRAEAMKGQADA